MPPLKNISHEAFCNHYVNIGNGARAYRNAYKLETNATTIQTSGRNAWKLLQKTEIQARVAELREEVRSSFSAEAFMKLFLDASINFDIRDYIDLESGELKADIKDMPSEVVRLITDYETKTKTFVNQEGVEVTERTTKLKFFSREFATKQIFSELDRLQGQEEKEGSDIQVNIFIHGDDDDEEVKSTKEDEEQKFE